jgi:hypothetical protein
MISNVGAFPCSSTAFKRAIFLSIQTETRRLKTANMNSTTTSNGLLPADVINQVIRIIDSSAGELRGINLEVSPAYPSQSRF